MTRKLKAKSMGIFVSNGRVLAEPGLDSANGNRYLRLLGGHVEFGERSDETLKREMMEELGTDIEVVALMDVIENIFTYEGETCHEIDFLYHATFKDRTFYDREEIPNIEPHKNDVSHWTPIADVLEGRVTLYPPADYARIFGEIAGKSK